jgi:hypothetical protein
MTEADEIRVPRPWVQVATICQSAIIEANTNALSVIKVTDRIGVAGFTPEMQPQPINVTLALLLKSDQMNGQYQVKIRCTSPTGVATDGPEIPFLFEGNDRGVQAVFPLGFVATESGVYWFDVLLEEETLTRIPLRVMYQRIQAQPGMPLPPGMGMSPPGGGLQR